MGNWSIEPRASAPVKRARSIFLTTALAATVALLVGCATAVKGPLLLHPVPPTLEKYSLTQGALVFSGPDFSVSARPWDYRLVAEEFRAAGETCPFGTDDTQVGRFVFFRVRLENRSTRTLVFNPMRASLLIEGEPPLIPLENSDLFAFTSEDSTGVEERGRAFRRTCFDLPVTIRPGQSVERYLVFTSPEDPPQRVAVELGDLWLDSKSFTLHFVFETFPGK